MGNRFGFKDLIQAVLLIALLFSVWLAMKQYDRQWDKVQSINQKLDDLTRDVSQLGRGLAHGVGLPAPTVSDGPPTNSGSLLSTASPARDSPAFARQLAAQAQPGYAQGDWLVDAFGGGVANLTPLLSGDVYASLVQSHVLDTLAIRNPETLEWVGLLAKSWQISDDGLQISFQLRDGVVFSDGQPLTAADVVFTYQWIMDEQVAAPRLRAYLKTITKVTQDGPHAVTFWYKEPYFEAFELAASLFILPKHFYGQFTPQQFNQSVGLLLGSGPYRLEDPQGWNPGDLIQMIRNDRYWGVPPAFDRLIYKEITNDVSRLTAFRNGDTDMFVANPEQYRAMLADAALAGRTQHYEYLPPTGGYRYIAWNQRRDGQPTWFADTRVRQAMTMLTDRARLVEQIQLGYAVPATGPFNPKSKQASPAVRLWPYDVKRAKALLAEAGFEDRNADGVLDTPDGQPFAFKLTYPSGNTNYEKMVLFLKDAYAKAGILLKPDPLEWSVFTDRLKNKNFLAITLGWSSGIETDIYQMFHSSQMAEGGDDFVSYKNPELDKLIEQARHTVDEAKRMALWHRCHEILHQDQPYTFLFFSKSLRFIDQRISNVQKLELGLSPRDEWWVPATQQRWTR